MNDISALERKYYPDEDSIGRLVMENFIRQNGNCEVKPGTSPTSVLNVLGRNGIGSLRDFYDADIESFAGMHGIGPKVMEIILQLKQKMLEELQQEP